MIQSLAIALAWGQAVAGPQGYSLGAPATPEGAKVTVTKLLEAAKAKDDAAYDKIAHGMVVMLAPDFAMPLDRSKFEQLFVHCTAPHVISSRAFPKIPVAQAVRIGMTCTDKQHPKPTDAVADIMADNEHTFMISPGGVENVWPERKGTP